ncbi:hypothetical protein M404DRAFT_23972 [Pisolithus tinctorius Marx 270]|uniref:Uncharacterized protein n=1 Tax=Pisolithus tinctorius Marx 270 TaxID=870435 RepID=A0A0C3JEG1_PISTI|nr:hypothetical protein M404DRAFT_23972 [Pisolithus tinctorius Marx 270]
MCDLEEGIRLRREALDLCPSADPHRSCLLSSLALCLRDRYDAQEVVADLEEAITLRHVVLELRPPGHPCRHEALGTLADYLRRRFQEQATMHDLEEASQLSREALEQCPSGHPDRPWTLKKLAACLTERFNRQKPTADFEEVMMLRHILLDLHPMGHLDRRKYLYDLAVPLWASFLRHFALFSSVEAQSLCQTFSRAHSTDHFVLTSSLHNLSLCLRHSVLQQAATVDLADAIRLATTVLQLRLPNRGTTLIRPTTPFVHQRAQALALVERLDEFAILGRVVDYLHILAKFLRGRFCSHRAITDLNEAIMVLQQVIRLRPARHPARASSLHALALCLVDRFRENATRADLDKAIEFQQAATDLLTPGDPGYDLLLERLITYLHMKIRSPMGMITSGTSGIERAGIEQLIWHVAFDALKNAPTRLLHTRTGKLCNRDVQVSHFVISQQYHRLLSSVTACDPYIDFECIRAAILLYFKFVTLSHHRGGGEPSLRDVKGSSIYDVAVVPKAGLRKLQDFCLVACRRG